ncbi:MULTISPECIES: hypothetical protein [Pseudomonas]|uniref:hypothetical protein n=1 Tax=Pseudomonas TaxID=286 RepID=UPI00087CC5F8|nr:MULTISPECIES: hypothetical protein [Pseudomonas]AZD93023.1 hypothetical protein C4K13_3606 [Pseudomonas chlororaphis subsp. aureofaciens]WDG57822.1 hypothetical protein PUP52_18420 [Pseudomonas chlororaphis]WDG64035.1 hypothetical protein PUP59_18425 [Pseudomonas chlororaphis]SDS74379.1 hypothetical protein SAMN04489803_2125 [Pseudomonas chlororaphis]SUD54577.1 phage protein [Pseudomonas chlororaphis]
MSFSLDMKAFVEKTKGNAEQIVQKAAIDMLSKIVDRSPVGNPELWAANIAHRQANTRAADDYDFKVAVRNTLINLDESNFTKTGKLRRGVKYAKPLTKTERTQNFDVNGLVAGKDYVGGRFRANWQVSFDTAKTGTLDIVDPGGGSTKAVGKLMLEGFSGDVSSIWLMNNLPYGHRLEYEGWSSQAPAGMVGITATEFQMSVNKAVAELP